MWRLVRDNILGFLGMFKDSHVWLQITSENLMPGESGFPPQTPLSRNVIPFKTCGYLNSQA